MRPMLFDFVRKLRSHTPPSKLDPILEKSYKFHSKHKIENNLDPDEGNSRLCSACKLPIFTTPFKATESGSGFLHDQCSNLPIDLDGSDLHPSLEPLQKQPNLDESKCDKCDAVCGDVLYRCRDVWCEFQLDVPCAWPVKILHRSHDHRLTVIRRSASFPCAACGTEHRPGLLWARPMTLAYVCSACDFWLHPHCATLPNAIQHQRHKHPLLLNYGPRSPSTIHCAICHKEISSWGVYSCNVCQYNAHILCAVTYEHSFEPVMLREAFQNNRVPELVNLPVPNEYTSFVRQIGKWTPATSIDIGVRHNHPLTLHNNCPVYDGDDDDDDDDDDVHRLPKCNVCVQFISPPFYTCSQCPRLFVHDCCTFLLPAQAFYPTSTLGQTKPSLVISETTCCNRLTNGYAYTSPKFKVDVLCILTPNLITHAAHSKTHVLSCTDVQTIYMNEVCRCCNKFLSGKSYNCTTCRNFSIHATCARLPATVRHVYDRHPLELVTAPPPHSQSQTICDACEQGLDVTQWYYGCAECEQAFHVDCVPCLDQLSLIKFEMTEVRVASHKCPLTLVRGHMVRGRRCGHCGEGYRNNLVAFECIKCYFSIHVSCSEDFSQLFNNVSERTRLSFEMM